MSDYNRKNRNNIQKFINSLGKTANLQWQTTGELGVDEIQTSISQAKWQSSVWQPILDTFISSGRLGRLNEDPS